jgi:threonine-phosphate decarboxylase
MWSRDKSRSPRGLEAINTVAVDRTHGGIASADVIDFSASINPLGPPQAALDEYHAAAAAISLYPTPYPERLTAQIADWLGVSSAEVIVGNGSTQLIHLFARVYQPMFSYIAVPTFSEFANAIVLNNRTPYAIELSREHAFTIQLADIEHAMKHRAQAVFIGRPNSPSGSMATLDVAEAIAHECERFHAFCVFDEAFIDFAGRAQSAFALMRAVPEHRRKGLIIVGSLTKIFAIPGLRVGFLAGPPAVIEKLRRHLEPWSLNIVAERVARACLEHADEFERRTREWLVPERTYFRDQLCSLPGLHAFPSAANFLMLEVNEPTRATTFHNFMLDHAIAVRDLRALPGCSAGMYRVAVRLRNENDHMLAAARGYAAGGKDPGHENALEQGRGTESARRTSKRSLKE